MDLPFFNMTHNTKQRITIFDLTRLVAMLFMVQGHVVYAFLDYDFSNMQDSSIWWVLWAFNRGFTAPVFLVVSGAVQIFANKKNEFGDLKPKQFQKRILLAIFLIIVSYLMHLPANIYSFITLDSSQLISFYQVNILQLIGVCLIIAMFLIKYINSDKILLIITLCLSIFFSIFGLYINDYGLVSDLHPALNCYLTYDYQSYFPLFPNAAYYFIGLSFGLILKNYTNDYNLFIQKYGLLISAFFLSIFFAIHRYDYSLISSISSIKNYSPMIILFRTGIVFLYITILAQFNKFFNKNTVILMFGKKALLVYILHLYFIYNFLRYNPMFNGYFQLNSFDLNATLLIVLFVMVLTFGSVYLIDYLLNKYARAKQILFGIVALLIINKLFWLF